MNACPDDQILAAYVDQTAANRDAIEEHLDGCPSCRVVVAHLGALGAAHDDPQLAMETARQTGPAPDHPTVTSPQRGAPLPPGARVDRYVVRGELGRGGMGVVLAAHDPQLDRSVALKIVRPGSRDESARARLLREARAMARLSHPNVVAIHDVGELDDGRVFLAMEHVRGTTLRRVLAIANRPFARTIDLFLQARRGLAAAHAAGLIHRDFKPDNVLVGTDGRVRVTDFGLARGTGSADPSAETRGDAHGHDAAPPSNLTGTGAVMGTPAYMAPEQCRSLAATPSTDQFSFCVTLFEALAGVRPFAGTTFEELAKAKIAGERRTWPSNPAVPAGVRRRSTAASRRCPRIATHRWTPARPGRDRRRRGRSRRHRRADRASPPGDGRGRVRRRRDRHGGHLERRKEDRAAGGAREERRRTGRRRRGDRDRRWPGRRLGRDARRLVRDDARWGAERPSGSARRASGGAGTSS